MKKLFSKLWKLWRRHPIAMTSATVALVVVAVFAWRMYGSDVGKWWNAHRELLEPIIWILDIVAFGLAIAFVFALETITESLSTRFIGRFPDNLDVFTDLVSRATRRIDVLWDGVDPGSYFDPEAHERLIDALLDRRQIKARKVEVRYVVWSGPRAISAASGLHARDFTGQMAKNFCKFHGNRLGFREQLGDAYARIASSLRVDLEKIRGCLDCEEPDSKSPEFEALQLCLHEWLRYRLEGAGIKIKIPNVPDKSTAPEIFFFIVDGLEAAFVFLCPGQDALAFRTRDSKLLETLAEIFDSRYKCQTLASPSPC